MQKNISDKGHAVFYLSVVQGTAIVLNGQYSWTGWSLELIRMFDSSKGSCHFV